MFFAAVFVWFMILLYHHWNGFTQCISGFTTMHCIKRLFTYLLTGWCSIGAVHLFVCLSVCLFVCLSPERLQLLRVRRVAAPRLPQSVSHMFPFPHEKVSSMKFMLVAVAPPLVFHASSPWTTFLDENLPPAPVKCMATAGLTRP